MRDPYRLKISKGIYHIGFGKGGGINSALRYSKETMDNVKESETSYYTLNRWKFVKIKEDGTLVDA